MIPSTYDTCLLSVSNPKIGKGVLSLQIDNTFFIGDKKFIDSEERELKKANFKSNEKEFLTTKHPIDFNRGHITLETDGSIKLTQDAYLKTLKLVAEEPLDLVNSRGGIR
ncbi:uncharacterized protein RSE6_04129 [Rhynchosporium secalis]|uniref:Uncharacterized protein n=1 Tax=Rhynchosporium secalis TaxID=38038 RepID=A0A1E1M4H0_RHYSE|nr:uncharacterized protein RSE6_04129 [Rhynchosporium secalis]